MEYLNRPLVAAFIVCCLMLLHKCIRLYLWCWKSREVIFGLETLFRQHFSVLCLLLNFTVSVLIFGLLPILSWNQASFECSLPGLYIALTFIFSKQPANCKITIVVFMSYSRFCWDLPMISKFGYVIALYKSSLTYLLINCIYYSAVNYFRIRHLL